jgi:hypothetical protein
MIDSKRYVFGCFAAARTEMAEPEKEKREQSSRTPHGIIYEINYNRGGRRVKENFGKTRAPPTHFP